MGGTINAPVEFDVVPSWDYDLTSTGIGIERLRDRAARTEVAELREEAWELMRPLFAGWADFERSFSGTSPPQRVVEVRERYRLRGELTLFRYTNFADASRLLKKDFPDSSVLERADEGNPGAPPAMHVVYERVPRARGPFAETDRRVIEALDHAALRIPCVDVVHDRTAAACAALVPAIRSALANGDHFFILDVACGGNRLARTLEETLSREGVLSSDLHRIHVLGVDIDKRAAAYTFRDLGLANIAWCDRRAKTLDITLVHGNLFDSKTTSTIDAYLRENDRPGFDAVTALGIFDYFDCPRPDRADVYIPEMLAAPLAERMRTYTRPGGRVVAAVFAAEDPDPVSTGARHLFANWHIEHARASVVRRWFSYARETEIGPIPGFDSSRSNRAHFVASIRDTDRS